MCGILMSNDILHYVLNIEFLTLISLKVPSGSFGSSAHPF